MRVQYRVVNAGQAMSAELKDFTNPTEIVEAGERIYADKYKAEYEQKYPGQFGKPVSGRS
jgi:hypothetical protein